MDFSLYSLALQYFSLKCTWSVCLILWSSTLLFSNSRLSLRMSCLIIEQWTRGRRVVVEAREQIDRWKQVEDNMACQRAPMKVKCFMWRCLQGIVLVNEMLANEEAHSSGPSLYYMYVVSKRKLLTVCYSDARRPASGDLVQFGDERNGSGKMGCAWVVGSFLLEHLEGPEWMVLQAIVDGNPEKSNMCWCFRRVWRILS